MKKNKFPYKYPKSFRTECITYIENQHHDEFINYTNEDFDNFINTIDIIYCFTIDNLETIYNKGLKYPTKYFLERMIDLKRKNKKVLVIMFNSINDIINTYTSLFNKSRSELVNYYYNDILLYQYDKRLVLHQYNSDIKCYVDCNHQFIIDLDNIADNYGIYKLYNDDKQLVYIGKSYKLGIRIQQSLKERKCKYYSYCALNTKKETDTYEIYYINKLKPIYNIANIDTDISKLNLKELKFTDIKSNYPLCIDMEKIAERQISQKEYEGWFKI
jgi:hypothetical protein